MRWEWETAVAASRLGWQVVETDGVDDYQGWGVHLLRSPDAWAVLSWSYGSCSGCDYYEDRIYAYDGSQRTDAPADLYVELFSDCIERCDNEEAARKLFSDRKGW